MEICDRQRIPAQHIVPLRGVSGKRSLYHLGIAIEGPDTESLWAWARREKGRPYPNGTEFGMTPTDQPPPDQPPGPPRANGNLLGTNAPQSHQGGGRTTRPTVDHISAALKGKAVASSLAHSAFPTPTLPLVIPLPWTDTDLAHTGSPLVQTLSTDTPLPNPDMPTDTPLPDPSPNDTNLPETGPLNPTTLDEPPEMTSPVSDTAPPKSPSPDSTTIVSPHSHHHTLPESTLPITPPSFHTTIPASRTVPSPHTPSYSDEEETPIANLLKNTLSPKPSAPHSAPVGARSRDANRKLWDKRLKKFSPLRNKKIPGEGRKHHTTYLSKNPVY